MGPYSDAGNEAGPRVLKSFSGYVKGPGHNSIVFSQYGKIEYIAYHAWTTDVQLICLDKLIWTVDGPRCEGPTWTKQTIDVNKSYQKIENLQETKS